MKKLLLSFMLMIITSVSHIEVTANDSEVLLSEEMISKQNEGILQFNRLLEGLQTAGQEYPSYYAGSYLDSNKKLVVLVTNDLDANINKIKKYTSNVDISIKKVKYSLSELIEAYELVSTSRDLLLQFGVELNSVFIDEESNRTVVEVLDLNKAKEKIVRKLLNKRTLVFVDVESPIEEILLKGGQALENSNGFEYCTAGFTATLNGVEGFVTAAHCYTAGSSTPYVGQDVFIGGNHVGDIHSWQYFGATDAAFISKVSSESISVQQVTGRKIVSVRTSPLPTGTTLYSYGKNSGVKSGVLQSNYASSYYLLGVIKMTNILMVPGDSGGPVTLPVAPGRDSLVGINHARSEKYEYLYVSKYGDIASDLGVVAKTL